MGARRRNREGSIYCRKDGTWVGVASLADGRRKYLYGASEEEVRRKLSGVLRTLESGQVADARGLKVGTFLDQWLADVVKPTVRPWTFAGYEVHVRLHLKPALGRIPLERLTPLHVQQMVNAKTREGLKPKSIRYIRGTLRSALNHAVKWGLIPKNPATLVDTPRVEQFEISPLTPDEARRFLASLKGDRLEALYSVALTMGLRQGEALGLRWQDVDLRLGYLRVNKQLQRINGAFELLEPKTRRSKRTIALPKSIAEKLIAHRARQLDEQAAVREKWQESDLVFTTPTGRPLDGTVVTHQFHRHLARTGLAQRRFHDLRHSCATLLLVQGVSPRVVMDVLGHSQIGLTMNTYAHVIPEMRKEAAERMEELIRD